MNTSKARNGAPGPDERDLIALIPRVRAFARCLCGDPAVADRLAMAALGHVRRNPTSPDLDADLESQVFARVLADHGAHERGPAAAGEPGPIRKRGPGAIGDLGRALLKLPLPQRVALALVEAAGRSYQDAATICDCAPGTIGSRISRGRSRLSAILAEARPAIDRRIPDRTMAILLAAVRARSGAAL